jgi:hypothetical protein
MWRYILSVKYKHKLICQFPYTLLVLIFHVYILHKLHTATSKNYFTNQRLRILYTIVLVVAAVCVSVLDP